MLETAQIEAFRRREDAGIRAVYREYGRLVYAVALRMLGQKELAEDATQQTFIQAWQAADRFDSERELAPGWPRSPGGWPSTSTGGSRAAPPGPSTRSVTPTRPW